MSAISQDLARIDSAKYGEEVRGSIHHAIEQCYTDVTTAETLANTAANNANTKAGLADAATTRANQAAATAENFTGLVAPTYSTSATYAVGDYVVYNGAMYRCIAAIETAEAWTAAHWTAVNTGGEVADLKSALSNNTLVQKTGSLANIDLDNVKDIGVYWHGTADTAIAHAPVNGAFMLVVFNSGREYRLSQFLFEYGGNSAYYRNMADVQTFGNWHRILIESDISEIESDISEIESYISEIESGLRGIAEWENLFNNSTFVAGGYFRDNGSIVFNADSCYSNRYISVTQETYYYYFTASVSPAQLIVGTYDENKNWLGRISALHSTFTVDANVKYLRISLYNGATGANSFTLSTTPVSKTLEHILRLKLQDAQINQLRQFIVKPCKIQKHNNGLYVYTPAGLGYLRYNFKHNVDASINCDTWRIDSLFSVDNDLVERFSGTVGGEWECAVSLAGRPDFSGGISHGDEVTTDIVFVVDGVIFTDNTINQLTDRNFDKLRIIETSNLYDPLDNETVIAIHTKEYLFTEKNLHLLQHLDWQITDNLSACYLAMGTPSKQYTDMFYSDKEITPVSSLSAYGNHAGVKKAVQYSASKGFLISIEVLQYPTGLPGSDIFNMRDNGGNMYNKMYFNVCTSGKITIGTRWTAETVYTFEVGEPIETE